MQRLETNLNYLPLPYRCAIEVLGASGERNESRLRGLCDHFEASHHVPIADQSFYRDSVCYIASKRFWDYQPLTKSDAGHPDNVIL